MMKLMIVLAAILSCAAFMYAGHRTSLVQEIPKESKEQPKQVVLAKDSQSDKYGEVPFNHENHATKNYSPDGKQKIACIECHHTDQPAADLKPPLKTSERNVVLTAELLQKADAAPVKSCRVCHLQTGDDSKPLPVVTYPDKPAPQKMNNELAYHNNCNTCHDAALKLKPELKGKVPGTNDCAVCHKPVG